MSDASQDGKSASWFASLRRPDTSDLSAESLAPLMNLTFERHRFGVAVMPVVGLPLVWFFSRTHDATGLVIWTVFFFLFTIVLQFSQRRHAHDMRTLDAEQLVRKWLPRMELMALLHGAGLGTAAA